MVAHGRDRGRDEPDLGRAGQLARLRRDREMAVVDGIEAPAEDEHRRHADNPSSR